MVPLLVSLLLLLLAIPAGIDAAEDVNEQLAKSIGYYVDGEYQKASDSLQAILPGIADANMQATAYKYLGFSYVMMDRIPEARESFGAALEKFPGMEVDTLEVPPSISVVFKEVKLSRRVERAESGTRKLVAGVLMGTGLIASGASGYFLYESKRAYDSYRNITQERQDLLDQYYNKHVRNLITGAGVGAAALAMIPTSLYLFFHKKEQESLAFRLHLSPESVSVVWNF